MPANRKNPGVRPTARQSRDREGALADSVAGLRSLTIAARIAAPRPSTFITLDGIHRVGAVLAIPGTPIEITLSDIMTE